MKSLGFVQLSLMKIVVIVFLFVPVEQHELVDEMNAPSHDSAPIAFYFSLISNGIITDYANVSFIVETIAFF